MLTAITILSVCQLLCGCSSREMQHNTVQRELGAKIVIDIGRISADTVYLADSLVWHPKDRSLACERIRVVNGTLQNTTGVDVWDIDSGKRIFATPGPNDLRPTWSPGGSNLLFSSFSKNTSSLAVAHPPDPTVRKVGRSGKSVIARGSDVWLDDNTLLFCSNSEATNYSIKTWNLRNNRVRDLWSRDEIDAIYATVDPTGTYVAYIERSSSKKILCVFRVKDGEIAFRSAHTTGDIYDIAWMRQPFNLYYLSVQDRKSALHKVDVRAKSDSLIGQGEFEATMAVNSIGDVAVTAIDPDGTRRVNVYSGASGDLVARSPQTKVDPKVKTA